MKFVKCSSVIAVAATLVLGSAVGSTPAQAKTYHSSTTYTRTTRSTMGRPMYSTTRYRTTTRRHKKMRRMMRRHRRTTMYRNNMMR